MERIKLAYKAPAAVNYLFDYYSNKSKLNINSVHADFYDAAETFVDLYITGKNALKFKEEILSFNFTNSEMFIFNKSVSETEKFIFEINFENFHTVVKNVLENNNKFKDIVWDSLKRQASPPYEAYHYKGHNELDIKISKSSYYHTYAK